MLPLPGRLSVELPPLALSPVYFQPSVLLFCSVVSCSVFRGSCIESLVNGLRLTHLKMQTARSSWQTHFPHSGIYQCPFSIQCGQKQKRLKLKQKQKDNNKSLVWILYTVQFLVLFLTVFLSSPFLLSVFQFVIIVCLRRQRKILNGNFVQYDLLWQRQRGKEKSREVVCTASLLPKIQRKWIRLWHSILYSGYPACYDIGSETLICQRKVFVWHLWNGQLKFLCLQPTTIITVVCNQQ